MLTQIRRLVINPAIANPNVDHASETRWGATVRVGGKFAFNPGVEYNHVFMGDRDITFNSTTAPFAVTRTDRISYDIDMVTARINYRFGGPVAARY